MKKANAQSRRFKETARERLHSGSAEEFERAFKKIVPEKRPKREARPAKHR
jgi:hypothetical protein